MSNVRPSVPVGDDTRSPGRGRQIVMIFLAIGVITAALTGLHALFPGNPLDQLVGITPIVLIGLVIATVWLLYRSAARRS